MTTKYLQNNNGKHNIWQRRTHTNYTSNTLLANFFHKLLTWKIIKDILNKLILTTNS